MDSQFSVVVLVRQSVVVDDGQVDVLCVVVVGGDGQWPSAMPSRHASFGLLGRAVVLGLTVRVVVDQTIVVVGGLSSLGRDGRDGLVGGVGGLAVAVVGATVVVDAAVVVCTNIFRGNY